MYISLILNIVNTILQEEIEFEYNWKKNSTNKRTPFENLKPLREIENNMPAPKYKSQIIAPDENMDKFTNLQNNYHYGKRTDKRQTQRENKVLKEIQHVKRECEFIFFKKKTKLKQYRKWNL